MIQDMIRAMVLLSGHIPHAKRWWNDELSRLKKKKKKLSSDSYKYRSTSSYLVQQQHRKLRNQNQYSKAIRRAKQDHWQDFLESGTYDNLCVRV